MSEELAEVHRSIWDSVPPLRGRVTRCPETGALRFTSKGLTVDVLRGCDTLLGKTATPNTYYGDVATARTLEHAGDPEPDVTVSGFFDGLNCRFTHRLRPLKPETHAVRRYGCYLGAGPGELDRRYPLHSQQVVHGKQSVKGSNNATAGPSPLWFVQELLDGVALCRRMLRAEEQDAFQDTGDTAHVLAADCNLVTWGSAERVPLEALAREVHLYAGRCAPTDAAGVPCFYVKTDCTGHLSPPPAPAGPAVRLRTMDAFSGCGGLGLGLEQSGLCDVRWASDNWDTALSTLADNRTHVTKLAADIKAVVESVRETGKPPEGWPGVGEVECLVGGPPCQGFSQLNRFPESINTKDKNNLIQQYLELASHYKPYVVILENVLRLCNLDDGAWLTVVIEHLFRAGYDVMLNILQAGHYGVPQTRRRTIVLATLPYCLPNGPPAAQHAFSKAGNKLTLVRGGVRYRCGPTNTAVPFRTVTIEEAFAGLPPLGPQKRKRDETAGVSANSWFTRHVSQATDCVTAHATKSFKWFTQERVNSVPPLPGADWRSIPNEERTNGKETYGSLKYFDESKTIVCPCGIAGDGKCVKQVNTFIPWCLPHKAQRCNKFAGCFGRNDKNGFLSTILTSPNLGNQQGRVLHPTENRILSARECARGQGFPDHYRFRGSLPDVYKQVGNAVPVPMARAIGQNIASALSKTNLYSLLVQMRENDTPPTSA